jgi:hypothetical protein
MSRSLSQTQAPLDLATGAPESAKSGEPKPRAAVEKLSPVTSAATPRSL